MIFTSQSSLAINLFGKKNLSRLVYEKQIEDRFSVNELRDLDQVIGYHTMEGSSETFSLLVPLNTQGENDRYWTIRKSPEYFGIEEYFKRTQLVIEESDLFEGVSAGIGIEDRYLQRIREHIRDIAPMIAYPIDADNLSYQEISDFVSYILSLPVAKVIVPVEYAFDDYQSQLIAKAKSMLPQMTFSAFPYPETMFIDNRIPKTLLGRDLHSYTVNNWNRNRIRLAQSFSQETFFMPSGQANIVINVPYRVYKSWEYEENGDTTVHQLFTRLPDIFYAKSQITLPIDLALQCRIQPGVEAQNYSLNPDALLLPIEAHKLLQCLITADHGSFWLKDGVIESGFFLDDLSAEQSKQLASYIIEESADLVRSQLTRRLVTAKEKLVFWKSLLGTEREPQSPLSWMKTQCRDVSVACQTHLTNAVIAGDKAYCSELSVSDDTCSDDWTLIQDQLLRAQYAFEITKTEFRSLQNLNDVVDLETAGVIETHIQIPVIACVAGKKARGHRYEKIPCNSLSTDVGLFFGHINDEIKNPFND